MNLKHLYQRKHAALQFAAEHGDLTVCRALAMLETGKGMTQTGKECLQCSLDAIKSRDDYAIFHLVVLMYLYHHYHSCLVGSETGKIRDALLDFCCWRDESENDSLRNFDEHQALLFLAGRYLAGCIFEKETCTGGIIQDVQHLETEKARLNKWLVDFLKLGYAELSSSAHILAIMTGLFALYLMAPDENVQHMAKQGLDKTFRVIAYNQFYGVISSCYCLAGEDTIHGVKLRELSCLYWIAAGSGQMTASSQAATLFALSSYEPPAWEKDIQVGRLQYAAVEWDAGCCRSKTYTYRTGSYSLSCIRRFHPSAHGCKPCVMHASMGLRAAPFFIHYQEEQPYGGIEGPSCRAGNKIMVLTGQYKALQMVMLRSEPGEAAHGIDVFAPSSLYDETSIDGNWFFARTEDAYLAVRFSNPFQMADSNENAWKEMSSHGPDHAVIVRMGSRAEFLSFANFIRCMHKGEFSWNRQDSVDFRDPEYGRLSMHMNGHMTWNGRELACSDAAEPVIELGYLGRAQSCSEQKTGEEAGKPRPRMIIFMDSGDTLIDEGEEVRDENGIVCHAELFPGAGEALRTLYDQGHTIALVADGETQSFVNIYNENGLGCCFCKRIISEEVGEQKPAHSMFQTALEALNLCDGDKQRIVMVGNNICKDVTGANRFGIHSILINRSSRYIMAPSSAEQVADFVIREPSELPGIIAWMEEHLL